MVKIRYSLAVGATLLLIGCNHENEVPMTPANGTTDQYESGGSNGMSPAEPGVSPADPGSRRYDQNGNTNSSGGSDPGDEGYNGGYYDGGGTTSDPRATGYRNQRPDAMRLTGGMGGMGGTAQGGGPVGGMTGTSTGGGTAGSGGYH